MRPTLYIETTIPSYLVAKTNPLPLIAEKQALTKLWWDTRRDDFELVTSNFVWDECRQGSQYYSQRRLKLLESIRLIPESEEAMKQAAMTFISGLQIPHRSFLDAFHLAVCVTHHIEILLTWNCTHLANEGQIAKMDMIANSQGWSLPRILTPAELLKGAS